MIDRGRYFFAVVMLSACFPHQKRIDAHRQNIEQNFPDASRTVEVGARKMHYVRTGSGPNLAVFIHGSPGSWDAFAEFIGNAELQRAARLISVDRLGFGKSEPMNAEKSLAVQCALISKIIRDEIHALKPERVVVLGHSFGGPIAARLAAESSNNITHLVLLAASVDPGLEKIEWYQSVADWRVVRWLLPQAIDNANQEILPLAGELLELQPLWKKIQAHVVVVHGTEDALVPVANADFLRVVLAHNPPHFSLLPNQGHFIPWEQPGMVTDLLRTLLSPHK